MRACSPDDADNIYAQADAAEQQEKWLVVFIHSLDGGQDCWGSWRIGNLTDYLDYLQSKNLWVGTFGAVVKYIKERESATLSVVSISGDQIVLNLTEAIDETIYDQPLTIRSEVPSSWGYVSVQQGSSITTLESALEGTTRVIYYNAMPDHGLISLKGNPQTGYPQITALVPQSVTAGSGSFVLQVTGNNFVPGSKVRWNGLDRVTTFVSATELLSSIMAADIATPGTVPVAVFNPDGGLSNTISFAIIPVLASLTVNPSNVVGGKSSQGTVTLDGPAPSGGVVVSLLSSNTSVASVPANVTVLSGNTSATFTVTTLPVSNSTTVNISAWYGGVSRSSTLTVNAPSLSSVSLSPSIVVGGRTSTGTVTFNGPAPSGV